MNFDKPFNLFDRFFLTYLIMLFESYQPTYTDHITYMALSVIIAGMWTYGSKSWNKAVKAWRDDDRDPS